MKSMLGISHYTRVCETSTHSTYGARINQLIAEQVINLIIKRRCTKLFCQASHTLTGSIEQLYVTLAIYNACLHAGGSIHTSCTSVNIIDYIYTGKGKFTTLLEPEQQYYNYYMWGVSV